MSSVFDPEAFTSTPVQTEGATVLLPIPAKEYIAVISDVKPRPWQTDKGSGIALDVTYDIVDDTGEVKAAIGGRDPKITQSYFLDLTPQGTYDDGPGKNVGVNRVRKALDMNKPGWTVNQLKGAGPLRINVILEPDKKSENVFNRVKAVAPIS